MKLIRDSKQFSSLLPKFVLVLFLLTISACGGGGSSSSTSSPIVSSFTSDTVTVSPESSANLTAIFENGAGEIDQGVGTIISGAAISVTPAATTTYTLTVTDAAANAVTSSVTVSVIPVSLGLDNLSLTGGNLDQLFQASQLAYTATVGFITSSGLNGDQLDNTALLSGDVYLLFTRTGSNWSQQAYIKASNIDFGDQFGGQFVLGSGLALFGEVLAVGAIGEASASTGVNGDQSDNSLFSGAVYVFE